MEEKTESLTYLRRERRAWGLTQRELASIIGYRCLEALARAQGQFLDLILAQQVADIQTGLPPGNKVAVKRLSHEERRALHEALAAVRPVDELTRGLLF